LSSRAVTVLNFHGGVVGVRRGLQAFGGGDRWLNDMDGTGRTRSGSGGGGFRGGGAGGGSRSGRSRGGRGGVRRRGRAAGRRGGSGS